MENGKFIVESFYGHSERSEKSRLFLAISYVSHHPEPDSESINVSKKSFTLHYTKPRSYVIINNYSYIKILRRGMNKQ